MAPATLPKYNYAVLAPTIESWWSTNHFSHWSQIRSFHMLELWRRAREVDSLCWDVGGKDTGVSLENVGTRMKRLVGWTKKHFEQDATQATRPWNDTDVDGEVKQFLRYVANEAAGNGAKMAFEMDSAAPPAPTGVDDEKIQSRSREHNTKIQTKATTSKAPAPVVADDEEVPNAQAPIMTGEPTLLTPDATWKPTFPIAFSSLPIDHGCNRKALRYLRIPAIGANLLQSFELIVEGKVEQGCMVLNKTMEGLVEAIKKTEV